MRNLLIPLSFLYGVIVFIRNLLYDIGVMPSKKFKLPVISVGNIVAGGTGKTPHVEYLVRLLCTDYSLAVLSRGYGRTTSGFVQVTDTTKTYDCGDEPKQLKNKFNRINVAVSENRYTGIKILLDQDPDLNVILLDDAFQHRRVRAGLSILLMEYSNLSEPQLLLPAGNLRELSYGQKRADIIIVTKTPSMFSPLERRRISRELKLKPYQKIYFSYIKYCDFHPVYKSGKSISMSKNYYFENKYSVLLLTGIANASYLENYLKDKLYELIPFRFPDHHRYTVTDINKALKIYDNIVNRNKIILTTEKDAMRLLEGEIMDRLKDKPLFYISIEIGFHGEDTNEFNRQIIDYVRTHQSYQRVHSK